MLLFQLMQALDPQLVPGRCKLHLAGWNGKEDPLDVFLEGRFDDWQSWQSKKNFERPYVVSLIALSRANHWLFVGAHDSAGSEWLPEHGMHRYRLRRREGPNALDGRLILHFERPGRQSYLLGDKWAHAIHVAEIKPERLRVAEFPGYSAVRISKRHLDIVVKQSAETWRSALASVSGIYVISDRHTGKLYVGSATGEGGIWNRWCAYSTTGHGENRELRDLLNKEGAAYAEKFQFGILEIADTHANTEDVLRRESHWKELLLSRTHGYNAN